MRPDNRALRARLEAHGCVVAEVPTAALVARPPARGAVSVAALVNAAQAIAFTSPHAVRFFFAQAPDGAALLSQRHGRGLAVGVVGVATQRALIAQDIKPDIVATPAQGAVLAMALGRYLGPAQAGALVVHPCAAHARPELRDGLAAAGLRYTPWVCYANAEPAPPTLADAEAARRAAVIYLAAPSAADRLFAWLPDLVGATLVCIGPTTAAHVRRHHGARTITVAQDPSLPNVEAAIVASICDGAHPRGQRHPQETP